MRKLTYNWNLYRLWIIAISNEYQSWIEHWLLTFLSIQAVSLLRCFIVYHVSYIFLSLYILGYRSTEINDCYYIHMLCATGHPQTNPGFPSPTMAPEMGQRSSWGQLKTSWGQHGPIPSSHPGHLRLFQLEINISQLNWRTAEVNHTLYDSDTAVKHFRRNSQLWSHVGGRSTLTLKSEHSAVKFTPARCG